MPGRIAAVQAAPVFLDRDATVARAVELIEEAARAGAQAVLFPEAFVPGYPEWVWRTHPWQNGSDRLFARLVDQAVTIPGQALDVLTSTARRTNMTVVMGIDELAGSTVYNSIVYLGPAGEVLGVHRKLMSTGGERLVWGQGDGSGLVTVDSPLGRIGGLICWENYMPLARAAIYASGIDVYVAPTWDSSDEWVPTLRHIAKEGRCYVVGTNTSLRESDVRAAMLAAGLDADLVGLYPDDTWINRGNACIVDPFGSVVAGPLVGESGIIYADVDADQISRSRLQFDVNGHYSRPDVFELRVDGSARLPARVAGPSNGSEPAVAPVDPVPQSEPASS